MDQAEQSPAPPPKVAPGGFKLKFKLGARPSEPSAATPELDRASSAQTLPSRGSQSSSAQQGSRATSRSRSESPLSPVDAQRNRDNEEEEEEDSQASYSSDERDGSRSSSPERQPLQRTHTGGNSTEEDDHLRSDNRATSSDLPLHPPAPMNAPRASTSQLSRQDPQSLISPYLMGTPELPHPSSSKRKADANDGGELDGSDPTQVDKKAVKRKADSGPGKNWRKGIKGTIERGTAPTTAVKVPTYTRIRSPPAIDLDNREIPLPPETKSRPFPTQPLPKYSNAFIQAPRLDLNPAKTRRWSAQTREFTNVSGYKVVITSWFGSEHSEYQAKRVVYTEDVAEEADDSELGDTTTRSSPAPSMSSKVDPEKKKPPRKRAPAPLKPGAKPRAPRGTGPKAIAKAKKAAAAAAAAAAATPEAMSGELPPSDAA
ncbi:uncharacterized protein L969DRAFT_75448 [Mixia osmundae IAM 14324]|uniref:Uncharacterized protein n=1 Tax=Mixia osmundae (strain CBS 9802 / IAM 14324 / JCM 22182 / KY 12970) TaxID=764103 RepID=G7E1A6_MIXOS|nr:uncharacterized protein L969DRAFT_75448 [Mixia osmundae IAM 14324]KEI38746.1 hypothetical protein L969DRAFT_75448 [Mixia osmundae IAM 14324]GAA96616.1 hypothetical protein E5Q_03286 [Mixia osmundae IAM 14324]